MKKTSSPAAANKVQEIEPFDKLSVNLTDFKGDIGPGEMRDMLKPAIGGITPPVLFLPIETLSATKTVGRGRTNLTIIVPTIVQTDSTTPSASFDRQATPSRNPVIQIHFEPSAYGITSVSSYVIEFSIQVSGQGTFNLDGFAGGSPVLNRGSKVLSGQTKVSLVFQNVQPAQQTFAFLEQTAGARWNWFSTRISFPPLVITQ